MSSVISGQVVLGCIRKVAEQARGSEQVSELSHTWPLLIGVSASASFVNWCKQMNPSLPKLPLVVVFITATEAH